MSNERLLGVIVALAGLTLLTPMIVFIALGTRLSSPGPVLIRSTMRRSDGTHFSFVRFPTSDPDSTQSTKFGAFLRRYSLDKLPALASLLHGEITLKEYWDVSRDPAA